MTAIFTAAVFTSCLLAPPTLATNTPSVNENFDYDRLQPEHLSPVIVTEPVTLNPNPGQTVTLDCHVTRLGNHSLTWRRGDVIISVFSGQHQQRVLKDRRYLPTVGNLTLFNVVGSDSGQYTCEVTTRPHATTLTHTINVNEVPSLFVTHPRLTPREGGTATLECSFRGYPPPTVTWRKQDHNGATDPPLPGPTTEGSVSEFVLENVTQQDSGRYICSASNSFGPTANAFMDVMVMHSPTVTVVKEVVYTGVGQNAMLMCHVSAYPSAKVKWQLADTGAPVDPMRLKRQHRSRDRRYLHFNPVLLRDLGTYVCVASNPLGADHGRVTLSAAPEHPEVISDTHSNYTTEYTLLWEVQSIAPILHYIINIRNATDPEEDSLNITVPGYHSQYASYHSQKKEFTSLQPNTKYVVDIIAFNEFGNNRLLFPFTFQTASEDEEYPDLIMDPDQHGTDSSLEDYEDNGGEVPYYPDYYPDDGEEGYAQSPHRHHHQWRQHHNHSRTPPVDEGGFRAELAPEQQQQRGGVPGGSEDMLPKDDAPTGNKSISPLDATSPAPPPLTAYPGLGAWLTVVVLSAFFC